VFFIYYATCHNFKPSLAIIINDGDQHFKEKKNLHNATCQILMDVWKSITSTWHYGYSCSEIGY